MSMIGVWATVACACVYLYVCVFSYLCVVVRRCTFLCLYVWEAEGDFTSALFHLMLNLFKSPSLFLKNMFLALF